MPVLPYLPLLKISLFQFVATLVMDGKSSDDNYQTSCSVSSDSHLPSYLYEYRRAQPFHFAIILLRRLHAGGIFCDTRRVSILSKPLLYTQLT